MKKFKAICIFFFIIFYSCSDFGTTTDTYYYQCFFLGDTSFFMDGEIFDIIDYTNTTLKPHEPKKFNDFIVKTSVAGWEITGTKTSESKYGLTIDISAGTTIKTETITTSYFSFGLGYQFKDIFPDNFPMVTLVFYMDDRRLYRPYYQEPRTWDDPQHYYKYDYLGYEYVYVAEPVTISTTKKYIIENNVFGGDSIYVHHFKLDFTKPGWYKIIQFDSNYNTNNFKNNAKHKTGRNTNFYLGYS